MEEKYPAYFLGETIEEAEETHNRFVGLLNSLTKEYSLHTGLDKSDLFNEALFGLAEAVKKYDPERSNNFKDFALFKVKDKLNEYVRIYGSTVNIPKYIDQTMKLIKRINNIVETYGYSYNDINLILNKEYKNIDLSCNDLVKCEKIYEKIQNIANRSSISIEKLLKRTEFIPIFTENEIEEVEYNEQSSGISEILDKLEEDEVEIALKLMEGKTYEEIAMDLNKSSSWVSDKIKIIRKKIG